MPTPDENNQVKLEVPEMPKTLTPRRNAFADIMQGQFHTQMVNDAMQSGQAVPEEQETPTDRQPMDYTKMMEQLSPYKPPTEEEVKAAKKKQKRERILASIADGLSAFHNAYAWTSGVAPMRGLGGYSERVRNRQEALRREREAKQQEYVNAYIRNDLAQQNQSYKDRYLDFQRKREERFRVKNSIDARKQQWQERYQAGTLDLKAEQIEIDRQYKNGLISKMERDAASNELRAQAAMIRANKYAPGGGSRVGGYTTTTTVERDKRGREVSRKTTRVPAGGTGGNDGNGNPPQQQQPQQPPKTQTSPKKKKSTGVNWQTK